MERIARLKLFITVMYTTVVLVETLATIAFIMFFATGDGAYFALACFNSLGVLVLHEMLKAHCRSDTDWCDVYVESLDMKPLPGPLYRLARAIIKRRRLQPG